MNKDCFAFNEEEGRGFQCSALRDLFCRFNNECPFYKKSENDKEVSSE